MPLPDSVKSAQDKVGQEWDAFSHFVREHPKTGVFICLIVGILLDHYIISLVW